MGAITALVMASVLSSWVSGYLEFRAVYDLQVWNSIEQAKNIDDVKNVNYNPITKLIKDNHIVIDSEAQIELFFLDKKDFEKRDDGWKVNYPYVISLSDYNQMRSMAGYSNIALKENEFTTQWHKAAPSNDINAFLKKHQTLAVKNTNLSLAEHSFYQDSFGEVIYGHSDITYILPDNICHTLTLAQTNSYINFNQRISFDLAKRVETELSKLINKTKELTENHVEIRLKTLQYNDGMTGSLMILFLMIYGGIVLLIMCFTILSVQQLAETAQHRYRFSALKKIGVENHRIRIVILKQMCIWFGIPIAIAFIGSAILLNYTIHAFAAQLLGFMGRQALIQTIIATVLIVIVILICYFWGTWTVYLRNVSETHKK
jgi:putative ABC transport system permease protein